MSELIVVSDEVREAIESGAAVVALETTLVAHGFPAPDGVAVGLASEAAVRAAGAVPATTGVLDGRIRVGLGEDELARFGPDARKLGPRDLAACAVAGDVGATTVGGMLTVARSVGIRFVGTGGIGGVHRGFPTPPDVSADLLALVTSPVLVACSGAKSLLDIPATTEYLETLGIPIVGYRTDTLPLFYSARGWATSSPAGGRRRDRGAHRPGPLEPRRVRAPAREPAARERRRRGADRAGAARGAERGVRGQQVTPFVLAFLHERSGGRTLEVNRALIADNARLAAEVAVAFARL